MTRERIPFVTGQPLTAAEQQAELVASVADPRGMEWLSRIQARAEAEAAAIAPATFPRFDGCERQPADEEAIRTHAEFQAISALVRGILADRVLQLRICALLGKVRS
jgi:hypothetical protein